MGSCLEPSWWMVRCSWERGRENTRLRPVSDRSEPHTSSCGFGLLFSCVLLPEPGSCLSLPLHIPFPGCSRWLGASSFRQEPLTLSILPITHGGGRAPAPLCRSQIGIIPLRSLSSELHPWQWLSALHIAGGADGIAGGGGAGGVPDGGVYLVYSL